MTLSIEEEVFISAGLLTEEYDPEAELEEGLEHLTPEERKEDLEAAREAFLEVKGRIQKVAWEGGQPYEVGKDLPGAQNSNYRIRDIFASPRNDLSIAYVLGDMRLYCEPKQSLPGDSFRRVIVNRASPAGLHEPLTRTAFVDELSGEIRFQLREECPACKKPVEHDDEICSACGIDLEEEENEGEEAEDEAPKAVVDSAQPTS